MRNTISVLVILGMFAATFWVGVQTGRAPIPLYHAPSNDQNLLQWRRNWRYAEDSIVTADVISDVGNRLYVYLDYIYSGSNGDEVTACGTITHKGRAGRFNCSPTLIRKGRGFTSLRFGMSVQAREIECSDSIVLVFYDASGRTFFKQTFPYIKTWVKGENGFYGKLRALFSLCPPANT